MFNLSPSSQKIHKSRLGLVYHPYPSTARPPHTLQIRPHALVIFARRPTELVNRPSLASPPNGSPPSAAIYMLLTLMLGRCLNTIHRSENARERLTLGASCRKDAARQCSAVKHKGSFRCWRSGGGSLSSAGWRRRCARIEEEEEGGGEQHATIGQEAGARARVHAHQHPPPGVLHNASGRYLTEARDPLRHTEPCVAMYI